MSDLHLEVRQYQFSIKVTAPILLLDGDIGRFCDFDGYASFIFQCCATFEKVLLIAGNHEFYGTTYEEGLELIGTIVDNPAAQGKVVFLNRAAYHIPHSNVTVLGCTLHSKIGQDRTALTNDFRRIKQWTVAKHNKEHSLDVAWLKEQVSSIGKSRRIVIATHYAPTFGRTCHPSHRQSKFNQCFASNAFQDIVGENKAQNVTHWIYGHTHWNARIVRGSVLLVSNQVMNKSDGLSWWLKKTRYRQFRMDATLRL